MIRNRHRRGSYLMTDDESGFVHYREEMRQIWDGSWRHRSNYEERNPQEFVEALDDPRPLIDVRPEPSYGSYFRVQSPTIGSTSLASVNGVASHLFGRNGIETMKIEDENEPFVVA